MSKLTFRYKKENAISSFAFNVGIMLEEVISDENNNLAQKIRVLEAKILDFYQKIDEQNKEKYAKYFDIIVQKEGKIE